MDFDLWLRLRGRNVLYLSSPLARFRWHADSKSARGPLRGWRELLRVVRAHGGGSNLLLPVPTAAASSRLRVRVRQNC